MSAIPADATPSPTTRILASLSHANVLIMSIIPVGVTAFSLGASIGDEACELWGSLSLVGDAAFVVGMILTIINKLDYFGVLISTKAWALGMTIGFVATLWGSYRALFMPVFFISMAPDIAILFAMALAAHLDANRVQPPQVEGQPPVAV